MYPQFTYNNPYNPYSTLNPAPAGNQYQPAIRQEIVRVNGEGGAKAYNLSPNSSVLMLDETNPIVWVKVTDGAGFPTLTAYSITPYTPAEAPNTNDLEKRISRLEGIVNESYSCNVEQLKQRKPSGENFSDQKHNERKS